MHLARPGFRPASTTARQELDLRHQRRFLSLALALFLLLAHTSTLADTHYVSKTGSNTYPYDSWATATDSVQLAIEMASPWDTVKVGPGLYIEDSMQLKTGMVLSGAGSDSTTLEISKYDGILTQFVLMGDTSALEGFLIQGKGSGNDKGVVLRPAWNSIIRNNVIRTFNIGLWADLGTSSTAEVSNNTFALCIQPINILGGYPTIRSNRIYPPYLSESILCEVGAPVVENNVIGGVPTGLTRAEREAFYGAAEPARYGWSIFLTSPYTFVVRNNVMWGQGSGVLVDDNNYDGGLPWGLVENNTCVDFIAQGIYVRRNNVLVRNNLIADAGHLAHPALEGTLYNIRFEYNLIWDYDNPPIWGPGNTPVGNVFADPMFVDSLDFHLQAFSPAIDAGDSTILDKDGTRSDIGAYGGPDGESYLYVDLPPRTPQLGPGQLTEQSFGFEWSGNYEADFDRYEFERSPIPAAAGDSFEVIAVLPQGDSTFTDSTMPGPGEWWYRLRAFDKQGNASEYSSKLGVFLLGVGDDPTLPGVFALYPNFPNPFNAQTRISYSLPAASTVRLTVFDVLGRRIESLVDGPRAAGEHSLVWDAGGRGSGVYFLVLETPADRQVQRALLLK